MHALNYILTIPNHHEGPNSLMTQRNQGQESLTGPLAIWSLPHAFPSIHVSGATSELSQRILQPINNSKPNPNICMSI